MSSKSLRLEIETEAVQVVALELCGLFFLVVEYMVKFNLSRLEVTIRLP